MASKSDHEKAEREREKWVQVPGKADEQEKLPLFAAEFRRPSLEPENLPFFCTFYAKSRKTAE